MNTWIKEETGKLLKNARIQAGYTAEQISSALGFDIYFVEKGLVSLPMKIVIELTDFYKVPRESIAMWQIEISKGVQDRRKILH